jgi:hypothetical protein
MPNTEKQIKRLYDDGRIGFDEACEALCKHGYSWYEARRVVDEWDNGIMSKC